MTATSSKWYTANFTLHGSKHPNPAEPASERLCGKRGGSRGLEVTEHRQITPWKEDL